MEEPEIDPDVRREVAKTLREKGPLSHEELADEVGFSWDYTQKVIRELRTEGMVSITLDRRYELEQGMESAHA